MSVNFSASMISDATLRQKVENAKINFADGLDAKEIEAAGLSDAEVQELQKIAADQGATLQLIEEENQTEETTDTAATGDVDVDMPAETIDPTATEQLKAQIQTARDEYADAKEKSEVLAKEIDEAEDEYDDMQMALKKAVGKVEDAAIEASEEVAIQVNQIRNKAEAEGWDEARLKQELGNIGIPSISGEQRTLASVGIEVGELAKHIMHLSDLYAAQADTVDALSDRWGGFLQVDLNTIHVNLQGTVVVNELGQGGPEVSGAEGVSALDMQKFANMTNEQLTAYMQSNEGNTLLTAMQGMANEGVNLDAQDCAAILKTMLAEQDKSTGDAAKFGAEKADNIQVNQINGASKEELEAAVKKIKAPEPEKDKSCDPYVIKIDGVEYTMILDNKDDVWDTNDILGINDEKDNLFEALKGLESDGNTSTLTGEELAKAGIRLVAKNEDGTLAVDDPSKDFDLSKVASIDMTNLRQSADNDGRVGTFGHFDMTLTDGREITGDETFENMSTLQKLFKAAQQFFTSLGNVASDIISKLRIDGDEKAWYSEGIKEKVANATKLADDFVETTIEGSKYILDKANQDKVNAEIEGVDDLVPDAPIGEGEEDQTTDETYPEDPNGKKPTKNINVSKL